MLKYCSYYDNINTHILQQMNAFYPHSIPPPLPLFNNNLCACQFVRQYIFIEHILLRVFGVSSGSEFDQKREGNYNPHSF